MKKTILSPSLPPVSKIALGSLTVSPMQAALPKDEAADVIAYALDSGINMIDTAQYYENYYLLRAALERCAHPEDVVVSTKTYAYSRSLAEEAVEEARRELDRDVIDIFMLHEQESYNTLRGHMPALEYLLECRERGIIKCVGASTHHVSLVRGIMWLYERDGIRLDVCHPLYNMAGIGIADGDERSMAAALEELHGLGVGVYAMKALGGGHLSGKAEDALGYVLGRSFIDAVAVGMQSREEIDANLNFLEYGSFSADDRIKLGEKKRRLHVEDYCEGCGACVRRCSAGALSLVEAEEGENEDEGVSFTSEFLAESGASQSGGRKTRLTASADDEKCVRCGYCTKVCPVFALKVY